MSNNQLVISPVYNEEKYIEEFYQLLRESYKQDVIFIDDGSSDQSRDFLEKINGKSTFAIRHRKRRGYGAALISGFEFAKDNNYEKIVTLDVDLQHRPKHIPDFFSNLDETDVVLGSRYIKMERCLDIPRERFIINRYISKLIKLEFGWNFTDPFCGFRAYRTEFLKQISFTDTGYGLALEVLLEIINKEVKFSEFSVEAIYFKDKRKFLDGLDDARKRLTYYLSVISEKIKELYDKEEIPFHKPSSR
ncbi:MAG: glycosyltransferase family 2 protein [Candidatus Omnitrophica bacterium]|nr:glycosyltransferase family 2 protein [Candidatus Omnitrophota bacterium]MCF7897252.1 glycosyltransferase family 2 protein [Candidatus Omnitrophota bacterium]MCF7909287.1 glycosyltransferase family 2 protein [Candidatus Omnitrophota bacterium]